MKRVFAFIGFTVAITLIVLNAIAFEIDIKFIYMALILAVTLFLASLLFKVLRKGAVVPVVLGSVVFGCCVFLVAFNNTYLPQSQLNAVRADVTMEIISLPEERDSGGYTYTAKVSRVDVENAPQNFKVKLNSDAELGVDSYTDFDACVQFYSIADTSFGSYSYFGDNIFLSANVKSVDEIYQQNKSLGYYFLEIKSSVMKILEYGFSDEVLGLATALLLGNKVMLDDTVVEEFQVCGISHIIAVSGLHISVICLSFYYLLRFLDCSKGVRVVLSLLALVVYSGVVGFPKSVLRAGIMIFVLLVSKLVNSRSDTLNSLGLATFIICLNPFAVTDVSALLTVTAVLGILVVKPRLDEFYSPKTYVGKLLQGSVNISVGVILSTLPVIWLVFGRVSFASILVNIIAVPLTQVGLISVCLYVMVSGMPFLAFLPQFTAEISLGAIIKVSEFCADKLQFLFFDIENEIFGIAVSCILIFMGISLIIFSKISTKIMLTFICVIFSLASILNVYQVNNNAYVFISQGSMIVAYDKDTCVVVGMNDKSDYYDYLDFSREENYFIDCKYDDFEYENLYNGDTFISDTFSVCENGEDIILTVCDKNFKITDDCVIINNSMFYRNAEEKFNSQENVTLVISKEV